MTNTTYNDFYFEDLDGYTDRSFGEYELVKEEIIEFAKKWDPMIFHTDEEVAKTTPHGGLIAPGTFLLAIRYDFYIPGVLIVRSWLQLGLKM